MGRGLPFRIALLQQRTQLCARRIILPTPTTERNPDSRLLQQPDVKVVLAAMPATEGAMRQPMREGIIKRDEPVIAAHAGTSMAASNTATSLTFTTSTECPVPHLPVRFVQASLPTIDTESSALSRLQASAARPQEVQPTYKTKGWPSRLGS